MTDLDRCISQAPVDIGPVGDGPCAIDAERPILVLASNRGHPSKWHRADFISDHLIDVRCAVVRGDRKVAVRAITEGEWRDVNCERLNFVGLGSLNLGDWDDPCRKHSIVIRCMHRHVVCECLNAGESADQSKGSAAGLVDMVDISRDPRTMVDKVDS